MSFIDLQSMQDTPLHPKQMLVQITQHSLDMQFFRVQFAVQTHLIIFNSSGGATCLLILIGIIGLQFWSHFNGSSILTPLHSFMWRYTQRTCCIWSGYKGFNLDAMPCVSWHFLIIGPSKVYSLLPTDRRSSFFFPNCNMYFLSHDGNGKILNRIRNSWFFKNFCITWSNRMQPWCGITPSKDMYCKNWLCKLITELLSKLLDINSRFTKILIQMHGVVM